jgi:hypothetical protein
MVEVKKKYIVDENNERVAVQIDIKTFELIEEILENFALVKIMEENNEEELLESSEARAYYDRLEKVD